MRERGAGVRFVVIGCVDVQQSPWQSEDAVLSIHGRYSRADLPQLLAHYGAEFALYPSEGPESFSYTLSEIWRAGIPALVPPIGALAERVSDTRAGWLMSETEWSDDDSMLDRVLELVSDSKADARRAAAANARAIRHPALDAMTNATMAHYDRAIERAANAVAAHPFTNARLRDALDYRPWTPPKVAPAHVPSAEVLAGSLWQQRIVRRALGIRRTAVGRFLYRMAPSPLIDALKARLGG